MLQNKGVRIWAIVTAIVLILAITVNILTTVIFYDIVSLVLGRGKPVFAEGVESMYLAKNSQSRDEAFANANAKNIEVCGEGFVLLKNSGGAFPLPEGAQISVFGKNSVNLSYGGSGSSGSFPGVIYKTLYDSLEAASFDCNPTLKEFYEDDSRSGSKRALNSTDLDSGSNQKIAVSETPQSMYTEEVKNSYTQYRDAAIVVITRIGGEGFDLPRYQGDTSGAVSPDSHYLELDQNERDLLTAVCGAGFQKVIVLFNIPSAFEAAFLTDPNYLACADRIDACLWVGFTGGEGIMAVGSILNGAVNPSGRTVDTWSADFSRDPVFVNFGTGSTPNSTDEFADDGDFKYYFADYEESIYVGYRYYETRALTDGEDWYRENVVYPFGYGLSYTSFDWALKGASSQSISSDSEITVSIEVTNIGDQAGKEVVQLYCEPPYYDGGIEKAAKVLCGFAKTSELQPGESEIVEITFDPYHVASYDYRDENNDGFCGYELEKGIYRLYISKNAHESLAVIECVLDADIHYGTDPVTGNTVGNRYTQFNSVTATNISNMSDSDAHLSTVLSRTDWDGTWPEAAEGSDLDGSAYLAELRDSSHNNPNDYSSEEYPYFGEATALVVRDLLPAAAPEVSYREIVSYEDERWETILNACNPTDLTDLTSYGAYQTKGIAQIGLPQTYCADGPAGFSCFMNKEMVRDNCNYCSQPVMASTWNTALIEELGEVIGEEGIWGSPADGTPYSFMYAPGVNIHRSLFGGRCAEYFSEDPFISGKMGAAEIRGMQSKGVVSMLKHLVANEQETHRSNTGGSSWLTEQSLREIYLKPFEIAVKESGCRGIMSSFNRIGTKWTGGDYRLLTEILRDEWGFHGAVISDFNTCHHYMFAEQMAYAGGDLNLDTMPVIWCDESDINDVVVLRRNAKNIMYALASSNAMNSEVIAYQPPMWVMIMYTVDALLVIGLIIWGGVAFRKAKGRDDPR